MSNESENKYSAHELYVLLRDEQLRIPFIKQRGSSWSLEKWIKWINTIVKFCDYPSTLPNILTARVRDDIHTYQKIQSYYYFGDNDFKHDPHNILQWLLYDGAQRVSSIYTVFESGCYRTYNKEGEYKDNYISFNIFKSVKPESQEVYFKKSTSSSPIKWSATINKGVDFKWILDRLTRVHNREDGYCIDDVVSEIVQEYQAVGINVGDPVGRGGPPLNQTIIRTNLMMVLRSALFEKVLSVVESSMTTNVMVSLFQTYNNNKGSSLNKDTSLWMYHCEDILTEIQNQEESSRYIKRMSDWFRDSGLKKAHFIKNYLNVCSTDLHKDNLSEDVYRSVKSTSSLTRDDFFRFVVETKSTLDDAGIRGFNEMWNKGYLSMNVMYGLWLNRDNIVDWYVNTMPYIEFVLTHTPSYSNPEYLSMKNRITSGRRNWWLESI